VPALVGITLVASIISSLGAPLLPSIADSLGISLASAQWSLTSALLAGAVAAPVLGRLGDGPRRREAIIGALAVVSLGGLVAGLADSLPVLVVGRAMQGIGLGLAPITMAAARDHLPAERSPAVIGLLSISAATGIGAGYPLSGLIANVFDVHVAFLFGGAMSLVALAVALAFVPSSRASSAVPLDVRGAVLGGAGVVALLIGVGQGQEWGWGSPRILGAFLLAAAILALWVRGQLRRPAPLVDLRQLRHRAVLGADLAAILLGLALYMFLTVITEFVQTPSAEGFGFGASTLVAGLVLVPFSLTSLATSRVMPSLGRRIGARGIVVVGALAIAVAGAFFALEHSALWEACATMAIVGVGFGFTFGAIPRLITISVPSRDVGSAMGFYQVIRAIGFSVGSALVASILAGFASSGSGLPTETGYSLALWIGSGACIAAAAVSVWFLPGESGGPVSAAEVEFEREDAELASAGLDDAGLRPPREG
jgi:predicted MFS family arabinose efflux permease